MTFKYDCKGCGSHDELGPAGGKLSCTCDDPPVSSLLVTKVEDGEVVFRKTMADLMGVAV